MSPDSNRPWSFLDFGKQLLPVLPGDDLHGTNHGANVGHSVARLALLELLETDPIVVLRRNGWSAAAGDPSSESIAMTEDGAQAWLSELSLELAWEIVSRLKLSDRCVLWLSVELGAMHIVDQYRSAMAKDLAVDELQIEIRVHRWYERNPDPGAMPFPAGHQPREDGWVKSIRRDVECLYRVRWRGDAPDAVARDLWPTAHGSTVQELTEDGPNGRRTDRRGQVHTSIRAAIRRLCAA